MNDMGGEREALFLRIGARNYCGRREVGKDCEQSKRTLVIHLDFEIRPDDE